ncbi:hypothetical protein [Loktanella fryxellensis]|nr:hypothetical protein [Loktanella fryxellensis]
MGHGAIGCLLAALFIAHPPAFSPDMLDSVAAISREATGSGFVGRFAKAVPAGLLIAALVWMHPSGTRGVFLSSSP